MATKAKVAGWAAVIAVVPTLMLSVSGYVDAKAKLVAEQKDRADRDEALLKAYMALLERCSGLREYSYQSHPAAPAPPPPPAAAAPTPAPTPEPQIMYRKEIVPGDEPALESRIVRPPTASSKLDDLAKQFGYVPPQ
jgi:hypothetical protein